MKKLLAISLAAIFLAGCEQGNEATDQAELTNMCPALPDEIASLRPKYGDYVTTDVSEDFNQWSAELDAYIKADKEFKSEYSDELAQLKSELNNLLASQHPSQNRFYLLSSKDDNDHDQLSAVKSACWEKVMGIDEFKKDGHCQELDRSPDESEWDEIYKCTSDRAESLEIEVD